jgi:hypothetical protein
MTDNKKYNISLTKTYNTGVETILNLFRDSTVLKLTGADDIQSDFKAGGPFRLTFNNRGTIHGHFIKISDNELILEWNVEGFQRPEEIKTIVEISLRQDDGKCILTLNHKNIMQTDSADAKQRAWTEILENMERELSKEIL